MVLFLVLNVVDPLVGVLERDAGVKVALASCL